MGFILPASYRLLFDVQLNMRSLAFPKQPAHGISDSYLVYKQEARLITLHAAVVGSPSPPPLICKCMHEPFREVIRSSSSDVSVMYCS